MQMWYYLDKEKSTHHKTANIFSCVGAVGSEKDFNDIMNLQENIKIDQVKQKQLENPQHKDIIFVSVYIDFS